MEITINNLIKQVKTENLFNHVLQLEGIRHPIIDPAGLQYAAEYIKNQLKKNSFEIKEHTFSINHFDCDFKNIEAYYKSNQNESRPKLYISAHYDTVFISPGANDNASGISVMLEAARILAKFIEEVQPRIDVRFIGFAFEERLTINELPHIFNFWNNYNTDKFQHFHSLIKQIKTIIHCIQPPTNACNKALSLLKNNKSNLNRIAYKFIERILELYKNLAYSGSAYHDYSLLGSTYFVEESIKNNLDIYGCINLETIGYSCCEKHSQRLPTHFKPNVLRLANLLKTHHTKRNLSQGNFINIICDKNSSGLGKLFFKQTKYKEIVLPSAVIYLPYTYAEINQKFPNMLRSDHAPFWKNNIPALFITDTANFRYPYYHTEADTVDKLDFEFMGKVCKAVIGSVVKACKGFMD